jgi:hypothetical protein
MRSFVSVIVLLALSACTSSPRLEEDHTLALARLSLAERGIDPADITMIGIVADRSGTGVIFDHHVWVRLENCQGWFVQRVGNPIDLFTLGDCNLPSATRIAEGGL